MESLVLLRTVEVEFTIRSGRMERKNLYGALRVKIFMTHDLGNIIPFPSRRKVVFVVDDEAQVGLVVCQFLEMDGYVSVPFTDPHEAIRAYGLSESKPDLILTDFTMGAMNGMELVQHFRTHAPLVKLILFSGNVGEEIMDGYPTTPDAFLSKPFLPNELLDLIKGLLNDT